MTVKELIEELEKVENKNLEVIIQTTDPTDWVYHNVIEDTGIESILFGDDDNEIEAFIIDGGFV